MIDHKSNITLAAFALALVCETLAGGQPGPSQALEKTDRATAKSTGANTTYDATDRYEVREVEGWTVLVNKRFLANEPKLAGETLSLLRQQLHQIVDRVPALAVKKLRAIHIWVEQNEPHHPCMAYHPDPEWLREHGMNPQKARCVELSDARNFLEWTREQPWMVLHELSHGYHHQFLKEGFRNIDVAKAFDDAIRAGRYESVLRSNGKKEKAYATTNPMEYFAEASEAYFGINDFYPVNREDLRRHDPGMFAIVERLWRGN